MRDTLVMGARRLGSSRALWIVVDALLVATLAAVFLFPIAARVSASDAGAKVPTQTDRLRLPPVQRTPAPPLRDVPVFSPKGPVAATVARGEVLRDAGAMRVAVDAGLAALVGQTGATVSRIVSDERVQLIPYASKKPFTYPFRYPRLDPMLDRVLGRSLGVERSARANDVAGLLLLASARFPRQFPNAGPVAYSLLDRARSAGSCASQLNLAFLLSTDAGGRDDDTRREFRRAERACPRDPTPLYLLGQFQSQRTVTLGFVGQGTPRRERLRRTLATFRRLQRLYPGSAAGWAGEGDAWLRLAYDVRGFEPFTARNRFRKALALYRRAAQVSGERTIAAGAARAQEGLGHLYAAVQEQRRSLGSDAGSARLQAALIAYLEEAHSFVEAASENGRFLARPSHLVHGPGLFPGAGALNDGIYANDADDPLSLGADRLQPLISVLSPPPELGAGLEDVSFIPLYHDVYGLTGVDRWCRGWSWRRDLILAGQLRRALEGLPKSFRDPKLLITCEDPGPLRQAALAESGRLDEALADVRRTTTSFEGTPFAHEPNPALAYLQDARQNLWRFAGNRPNALSVFREWKEGFLPADREGEIRYLERDFGRAATLFEAAARRAARPIDRAGELLKAGTANEQDGRFDDARRQLREADTIASRIFASDDFENRSQAAYTSYNARVQLGDTELRARRFRKAVPYYEAARRRQKDVEQIGADKPLVRPEVLDSNEALVLAFLGRGKEALAAIERALAHDGENPIFLENKGLVLYRAGRLAAAERAYAASLASDPTIFPSANDLGVIRARQGRLEEAVKAFRRSIGAAPSYATAWFNLGLTLGRLGPAHLVESQGAFGRAFALDSGLRSHARELIFDADPFFTTLDLSKPLPPDWQYATSTKRAPVAVAAFVILLLLLRAGRALAMELLSGKAQEQALTRGGRGLARLSWLGRGLTPLIALAVTIGVVLWPLLGSGGASWPEVVAIGVGTLALAGLYLRVRARTAARSGVAVRHFTWAPALPLAIGATALGLGYAPLPPAEQGEERAAVRVAAVVALGAAAVGLLLLGRFTEVPLTRALGATALVMTASVLTPVEPLDGAFVVKGRAGMLVSLGLLAVAILLAVGVL